MHLHRILAQHMPEFKNQAKDVVWHIPNKYTQQMAQKSAVVSFKFFCEGYCSGIYRSFHKTSNALTATLQSSTAKCEISVEALHTIGLYPAHSSKYISPMNSTSPIT